MGNKRLTKEEVVNRLDEKYGEGNVVLISEYSGRRKNITLQCKKCGHIWEIRAAHAIYGDKHYCPKCFKNERLKTVIELKCEYCGNKFFRYKSNISDKCEHYFCSKTCGNRFKNEANEVFSINTYREKALKYKENKCACCGWDEDPRVLEAHHVDGNRNNNCLENLLVICPTCHRKITLGYYKLNNELDGLIRI